MPPQFENDVPLTNNLVPPEHSRKQTSLIITVPILFLAGALVAGYFWYQSKQTSPVETQNITVSTSADQFADWKTYRNEEYGFEFKYPANFPDFRAEPFSDTEKQYDGIHIIPGLEFIINTGTIDDFIIFALEVWPRDYFDKFMVISSSSSGFAEGIVWDKRYQSEPGPKFIDKNKDFAVAYSGSQDCPEKYCEARANVAKILSTFKFISTSTPQQ